MILSKKLLLFLIASLLMQSIVAQPTLPVGSSGNTTYGNHPKVGKYADIRGKLMARYNST